jgi:hypothetical protein
MAGEPSPIALPKGSRAVVNRRLDPADSLDFFPTPPWATRALTHHVIMDAHGAVWEPAAGEGHMAEVLRETFDPVHASDVADYGKGYAVGSFAGRSDLPAPHAQCPFVPDWIITNPPFNCAVDFAARGITTARRGVALLVRSNWAEGAARYNALFRVAPPSIVAQFAERVPMVKGRWDPQASTATAYAWFVWDRVRTGTRFVWIPPGCRQRLTCPSDVERFGRPAADGAPDSRAAAQAPRAPGAGAPAHRNGDVAISDEPSPLMSRSEP